MSNKTSHRRAAKIQGLVMRDAGHTALDLATWRVITNDGHTNIVHTLDARMPKGYSKAQRIIDSE